jgi:hypothetical protein
MVEMLQKEIQSLCNLFSLKIVKIEPANEVQSFFLQNEMPLVLVKHHLSYLHFTNWNGMNQSFPCRYGPI